MATVINLPKLGKTMEAASVTKYQVKEGDSVKNGDFLFEIETDKATMEVPSPVDGYVKCIFADLYANYAVETPILVLGDKDEKIAQDFLDSLKEHVKPVTTTSQVSESIGSKTSNEDLLPSRAESTTKIQDLKLGGSILLSRIQKITGEKMLQSKHEIPTFYLNIKADVTELVALRDELNAKDNVKISFNDFIIKAVAMGIEKFPVMAGQLAGNEIVIPATINVAFAVAVGQDLVTPVIKGVDKKNIYEISCDSSELIKKARNYDLSLTDLEDACITISNLGSLGIESFIPIVVPGQCSILGVGAIIEEWSPDHGQPMARKFMKLTVSVDHKIANGAYAAGFLEDLKEFLESPRVILQ